MTQFYREAVAGNGRAGVPSVGTGSVRSGAVGDSAGPPSPDTGTPLLRVRDVRTAFDVAHGRLRAVDGVSFDLHGGQTLGIVGESGSGKSVLARTIMNLLEGDPAVTVGGEVEFAGRNVRTMSKAQRRHFWGTEMAMVFQDPMTSLNPVKRVGTHLVESLRFHLGSSRTQARSRAIELLETVGIPEAGRRVDQYPHELSGGMRQRVVIAMALACRPTLLLADEPTTALDVTVQRQILDLLEQLGTELDMATILISHDLGVVAGRADRVAVMYAGRIVETAPTVRLFDQTRHPYTEALLGSVPRLANPSHTRLAAIAGRPPDLSSPASGCRFAPRCRYARPRCLQEDPETVADEQEHDGAYGHRFACHFPANTAAGIAAREENERAGRTAAGLRLDESGAA